MCDCDSPRLYNVKTVKTRKLHECIECCEVIPVGEQASKVDALYDEFQTFYTCTDCKAVIDYIIALPENQNLCWCHGELYNYLWDSGYLYSEEAIEEEAASFLPNYDEEAGVIRGRHFVIASTVDWLSLMVGGRFKLKVQQVS